MSIYMSTFDIGDEHKNSCARMSKVGRNAYRQDDSQSCTCGSCPIIFQGSHVLPSDKDKRGGCLMLAAIPGHIDFGRRQALSDGMRPYHPWLRLSLFETGAEPTVVLTRKQVEALRNALSLWLETAATKS